MPRVTTARPVITTYRPVPDYLAATESLDIADIIADLIVEQIENTSENDGKSKNKRFLDLLAALTNLEAEKSTLPPPLPPPLPPGPPYLPPNSLPPNSVSRPPYLFPTVSAPPTPPPRRVNQNTFQTNFNKNSFQSTFQETRPIKPFIKGLKNSKKKQNIKVASIDSMIKNLLSNEISPEYPDKKVSRPRPKRPQPFYPYPKQFETRKPVKNVPTKPTKKKESTSISRFPVKPAKKKGSSSFSRYPIKIPEIKQSQHFSLPIDSLADFNRRKPENLDGRNSANLEDEEFISFSDQLRLMLEELGSREP